MGRHGGKTIHSHRLWAVTELMKQTFGLKMNKIGTQRVWDYVGDEYVHRLIASNVDGKLVEGLEALDNLSFHRLLLSLRRGSP